MAIRATLGSGQVVGFWTRDEVHARLEQAGSTLKRLRDRGTVWPVGLRSTHPDTLATWEDWPDEVSLFRLPPPSPRAIKEMDEAFAWFRLVRRRHDRLALWGVVRDRSLADIGRSMGGFSKEGIRKMILRGTGQIAAALNRQT